MKPNKDNPVIVLASVIAILSICPSLGASKTNIALVSIEASDISVNAPFNKITEMEVADQSASTVSSLFGIVPKMFNGEMAVYNKYFQIVNATSPSPDALCVKLHFGDMLKSEKNGETRLGHQFKIHEYTMLMNVTVEDRFEKVLFSKNCSQSVQRKIGLQDDHLDGQFMDEASILNRLLLLNLRTATQAICKFFTCNYKITIRKPSGDKDFCLDEVFVHIDDELIISDDLVRITKGEHIIKIDPGQGYLSQEFTVDIQKDSKTTVALKKKD